MNLERGFVHQSDVDAVALQVDGYHVVSGFPVRLRPFARQVAQRQDGRNELDDSPLEPVCTPATQPSARVVNPREFAAALAVAILDRESRYVVRH